MKQLQEGLAAVPKDAKDRFGLIAAEFVPGKTKEQCYEKFNILVAEAKARKNTALKEDEWTFEQQKQLETGLKTIPSKDEKRWDKIAALVDGKTRKECIARYKELVEKMKNKKK
jgi:acyl-CoA-binding protein